MTSIREARMYRRAIKRGWIKGQRWPTDASRKEIADAGEQRELTLKETAALAAFDGLAHGDARVKAIHASTVVAMERQNQKDELFADASEALQEPTLPTGDVTINVQQNNVVSDGLSAGDQLRGLIESVTARGGKPASSNGNGHA
jgi:hypothetical protein